MRWVIGASMIVLMACAGRRQSDGRTAVAVGTSVAPDSLVRRVHGCYVLRSGDWERDPRLNAFHETRFIPRHLHLTMTRFAGWESLERDSRLLYVVETEPGPPASRVFSFWQVVRTGGDSIHVGEPLPFAGAFLRLVPVPTGLAGHLTTFTDAIPSDGIARATVSVALDRVVCGSAQARRRAPAA